MRNIFHAYLFICFDYGVDSEFPECFNVCMCAIEECPLFLDERRERFEAGKDGLSEVVRICNAAYVWARLLSIETGQSLNKTNKDRMGNTLLQLVMTQAKDW